MKTTSIEYFNSEIMGFRELMGQKSFWKKTPEQRQIAIDGISYVYLNLANDDGTALTSEDISKAARILESTLSEYSQREFMMLTLA